MNKKGYQNHPPMDASIGSTLKKISKETKIMLCKILKYLVLRGGGTQFYFEELYPDGS